MRKLMSHAFSNIALREQYPLVANHINNFINQVNSRTTDSTNAPLDLSHWYNLLTFDIITDLAFGEPLHAVESGDHHPYVDDVFTSCKIFPIVPTAWEYPVVNYLLKALMNIPFIKEKQELGYSITKSKVEKRMATNQLRRKDFMTYVCIT